MGYCDGLAAERKLWIGSSDRAQKARVMILIPMAIVIAVMGALGYYLALHEGQNQQSKLKKDAGVVIPPPLTRQEPDAVRAQQASTTGPQGPRDGLQGVPLHP